MTRAFWNNILADHAAANLIAAKLAEQEPRTPTPHEAWLSARRDEVMRRDPEGRRCWIKDGCLPAVRYGDVR